MTLLEITILIGIGAFIVATIEEGIEHWRHYRKH